MRLLLDQNLPHRLTELLAAAGHEVTHTEDEGMATSSDPAILAWCCREARVLLTADKKLTKFLASSRADCPSVLILRSVRTATADDLARLLISNLPQLDHVVSDYGNAIFTLRPDRPIRAELLPVRVGNPDG